MADVTLPQLGETVTEGTITRWFKQIGDTVAADEPLFEVSTDKVDTEVPSPVSGTLSEIRAQEGDTVPVGAVIAVVGDGASAAGSLGAPGGTAGSRARSGRSAGRGGPGSCTRPAGAARRTRRGRACADTCSRHVGAAGCVGPAAAVAGGAPPGHRARARR